MGKGEYDLSEMFVVHHTMVDRGVNYARYHGDSSFSPGGSFYDIMYCLKNYGLVPQEAMPGIMYGDTLPCLLYTSKMKDLYNNGMNLLLTRYATYYAAKLGATLDGNNQMCIRDSY